MALLHEAEKNLSMKTDDFKRKLAMLVQPSALTGVPPSSPTLFEDLSIRPGDLLVPSSISRDPSIHTQSLGAPQSATMRAGPVHNIPGDRNPAFFAREEILEDITRSFMWKAGNVTPCAGLFGMAGVGKTEIALKYAYLCLDHSLDYVFMLNARSPESLRKDFSAVERLLMDSETDTALPPEPRTTIAVAQNVVSFLENTGTYTYYISE
jgi:hypothetical protein